MSISFSRSSFVSLYIVQPLSCGCRLLLSVVVCVVLSYRRCRTVVISYDNRSSQLSEVTDECPGHPPRVWRLS